MPQRMGTGCSMRMFLGCEMSVQGSSIRLHKAVEVPAWILHWKDRCWGLPPVPSAQNSLVHSDPCLQGCQRCGHSGSFPQSSR